MADFKHISPEDRRTIECMLDKGASFKAIAKEIVFNHTSVAREVRRHIIKKKSGAYGRGFHDCIGRFSCKYQDICGRNVPCKEKFCRFCSKCSSVCGDYKQEICFLLGGSPYVCNGCEKLHKCTLEKSFYRAIEANNASELLLREARAGIYADEEDIKRIDTLASPLIVNGQSIHHICANHSDELMCSERTMYNYMDYGLLKAKNLDLPRKVSYRARKKPFDKFKVDKTCRIGRTYKDYLAYMQENGDVPQADSVIGRQGGKVLLTLDFVSSRFLLAYIRDANTANSVTKIFNDLCFRMGTELFSKVFPLILADNGSEFSDPLSIEFDAEGNRRSRVFYCDAGAPHQKGSIENNHEFIRRILPKGRSFDALEQKDISKMTNHINSYTRKILMDKSSYEVFKFFHGEEVLKLFGSVLIASDEILLRPKLLD